MDYFYLPQMNNPIYGSNGTGAAQTVNFANTQSGFVGGGQIGYNYQWSSQFVVGIEADMQGAGIRGSSSGAGFGAGSAGFPSFDAQCITHLEGKGCTTYGPSNPTYQGYAGLASGSNSLGMTSVNAGVDWLGTVRGRLGYLVTPAMLIYGTGGLTYGGVHASVRQVAITSTSAESLPYTITDWTQRDNDFVHMPGTSLGGFTQTYVGGGNKSQTLVGWNAGGGVEWMFMPNWSLKAEAIYWNMGSMNVQTFTAAAAPVAQQGGQAQPNNALGSTYGSTRVNYQGVIARAGVNYHFNWFAPAPVVANY
jgi:outer membrane immunogenic protein